MLLRSECNHLRKEGRKLRMQLDQASQQIHIERQKLKRLNEEKRKLQGAMAQSQLQPQEQDEEVQQLDATGGAGLDLTGGADSWAGGLALPTPKTGRVIRGFTTFATEAGCRNALALDLERLGLDLERLGLGLEI